MLLLLILPLVMISFVGCAETTTTVKTVGYDDFDFIDAYDEVFTRTEGTYLVYFYEPTCSNCNTIKTDVLAFASSYVTHNIYFFDLTGMADAAGKTEVLGMIGTTDINVPTLLVVIDGGFDQNQQSKYLYIGPNKILLILNDIQNGTFPLS